MLLDGKFYFLNTAPHIEKEIAGDRSISKAKDRNQE